MAKKILFKDSLCLSYYFFYKEETPLLYFIKSIIFTSNQLSVNIFYSCSGFRLFLLRLLIFCSILLSVTELQADSSTQKYSEIEELKALINKQQAAFKRQSQLIDAQGKQIQELISQVKVLSNNTSTDKAGAPSKGKPRTIKSVKASGPKPIKPVGKKPPKPKIQRPPEIPRLSDTVGGVLTRKGNIVVEPSVRYNFSDSNRVILDGFSFSPALVIGLIDLREIKRHSIFANLSFRYGITDRFEFDFKVPYVYRSDEQRSRAVSIGAANDEIFNATGSNIGDLELVAKYQLNSGTSGWPIFVGNFITTIPTGKSPFDIEYIESESIPGARFPTELATGSGFYSFQPSITALYPTDPAVFFGGLSYSYNLRTREDIGNFDPGDTLGISFGMGVSLNERTSFSLGYSHRHVFNSSLDGNTIDGSSADVGQLLIGYSYKFAKQTLFNLSLGIGVTEDSPNLKLDFRVPMTFDVGAPW
jgi:hypothetical protein